MHSVSQQSTTSPLLQYESRGGGRTRVPVRERVTARDSELVLVVVVWLVSAGQGVTCAWLRRITPEDVSTMYDLGVEVGFSTCPGSTRPSVLIHTFCSGSSGGSGLARCCKSKLTFCLRFSSASFSRNSGRYDHSGSKHWGT